MIETIQRDGEVFAIIIKSSFAKDGAGFFTPADYSLQLGYNNYRTGHEIRPHRHLNKALQVYSYQEVVFIKSGKVVVSIYDENEKFFEQRELSAGDVIHLTNGGHGFKIIDDAEMILIKQGPFAEGMDKVILSTNNVSA